jgi:TRAP-type C4-dicarboxylate transport system permease small subunit
VIQIRIGWEGTEAMSETDKTGETRPAEQRLPAVIRVIDRSSKVLAFGAAAGVVLLALNVCVDVVGRTLFHTPLTGTLEMTAYWWMPTLTLLAFAFTELQQEHIKVTILLDVLPLRMRQIVEGCFSIIATALLLALAYYTLREALDSAALQRTTPSKPPVAIWPFMFVAVAGTGMLTLQTAANAYRYFAGLLPKKNELDSEADAV